MKKFTIAVAALLLMQFLAGSDAKSQSIFDQWKELDNFHEVMSQTFHPMEDGNLEPIKSRSGELSEKADVLKSSAVPSDYNTPEINSAVNTLSDQCSSLHETVKNSGSDEDIKKGLSDAHDTFHKIAGLCVDMKNEHKHEHKNDAPQTETDSK